MPNGAIINVLIKKADKTREDISGLMEIWLFIINKLS